jgi:cytochrome c oxidase accessory protein FixG
LASNRFELDPERLATTDEHGNRVYLYPEDVKGKWKTRRFRVYWVLIGVYLILPWIYINERPALMLNLAKREFTILGFTLFGVEPILLFLLLISGLFFVAYLTSVFGRVWCGWGCPQTVFIQAIFLKIEALIEGKARQRMALEEAPWTWEKIWRRTLKWTIFALISLHIAHTFVGYFVGPRELFRMTTSAPTEHWGVFTAVMMIAAIFLLDFGWFREQFCIIACPYGRIQSVMMDEHSKVVAYDSNRGEPRKGSEAVATGEKQGDCVNCYNCVKVCPTGIDIRRGTQLECIACTQCIDACDDIMTRLKKPTGLIRYSNEVELKRLPAKRNFRPVVYAALATCFIAALVYFVSASTKPSMVFIRGVGAPFLMSVDTLGTRVITNKFTLKVKHQGREVYPVELRLRDESLRAKISIQTTQHPLLLDRAEVKTFVFFRFPSRTFASGTGVVTVEAIDMQSGEVVSHKEVSLVGPLE